MNFTRGLIVGLLSALILLSVSKVSAFGGNDLHLAATSLESIAKSLLKMEGKLAAPPKCVPTIMVSRAVLPNPTATNLTPPSLLR